MATAYAKYKRENDFGGAIHYCRLGSNLDYISLHWRLQSALQTSASVTINWSALGEVSIPVAIDFRDALTDAIQTAIAKAEEIGAWDSLPPLNP